KSVHFDKDHEWHMTTIHDFCVNDSNILLGTHLSLSEYRRLLCGRHAQRENAVILTGDPEFKNVEKL
ncbi:MAG: hypothetical protein AB1Z31_23780, partial [Desulfobacterales bacterium]